MSDILPILHGRPSTALFANDESRKQLASLIVVRLFLPGLESRDDPLRNRCYKSSFALKIDFSPWLWHPYLSLFHVDYGLHDQRARSQSVRFRSAQRRVRYLLEQHFHRQMAARNRTRFRLRHCLRKHRRLVRLLFRQIADRSASTVATELALVEPAAKWLAAESAAAHPKPGPVVDYLEPNFQFHWTNRQLPGEGNLSK